eukprot:139974-Chlamydomonas_euryale.AAC.2
MAPSLMAIDPCKCAEQRRGSDGCISVPPRLDLHGKCALYGEAATDAGAHACRAGATDCVCACVPC